MANEYEVAVLVASTVTAPAVPAKIAGLPFAQVACDPLALGCLQALVVLHIPVPPLAGKAAMLPPFQ